MTKRHCGPQHLKCGMIHRQDQFLKFPGERGANSNDLFIADHLQKQSSTYVIKAKHISSSNKL